MSSSCQQFTPHAWKPDLCANCLKPKNGHSSPIPATRRLIKSDTHTSSTEDGMDYRQRTKPAISSKPQTCSPQASPKPKKSPKPRIISTKDDNKNNYGQGCPDSSEQEPGEELIYGAPEKKEDEEEQFYKAPTSDSVEIGDNGHYYHKYDVTAKGRTGTGRVSPAKKSKTSAVVAQITHKHVAVEEFKLNQGPKKLFAAPHRVMEIMSEHVALPYTIVDVSTMPTDVNPDLLEQPPHLPFGVPENGDSSSVSSTLSSTHSSATSLSPRSSPRVRHRRHTPPIEDIPPTNPMDAHAYETIDAEEMLGSQKRETSGSDVSNRSFSRDTPVRSSQRSSALEAKMAALSKIDFRSAPVPAEKQTANITKTEEPVKMEITESKKSKGSSRSFFKKLFNIGSKESKDEENVGKDVKSEKPSSEKEDPVECTSSDPYNMKGSQTGGVEIIGRKIITGKLGTEKQIADEMKEALRQKASRSESLRQQISSPVVAAKKANVTEDSGHQNSNSDKDNTESIVNQQKKVDQHINKPLLSPKPKHTSLSIATNNQNAANLEGDKKSLLKEKLIPKEKILSKENSELSGNETYVKDMTRQLKRPPSVPPPAVPGTKRESFSSEGQLSPPNSPRSFQSADGTGPISPKPPLSPKPDGRPHISSPRLQRTSVNLEAAVANIDNMLSKCESASTECTTVVDTEADSGSSGDGSVGSISISPKDTLSCNISVQKSGRGVKRVKDPPPGTPPPPPPETNAKRMSLTGPETDHTLKMTNQTKIERTQTLPIRKTKVDTSISKQLRSRTLTDGIAGDLQASKKERRISELLQRELPTPPCQNIDRVELNNTKELVEDSASILYEDIEDVDVAKPSVMPAIADYSPYLEPISHSGRPPPPSNPPPAHISPYANRHSIDVHTKPALTVVEAYHKMAAVHEQTIHQLLGILMVEFGGEECEVFDDLMWRQLQIDPSELCLYSNQAVSFYRCTYRKQQKKQAILMICRRNDPDNFGHDFSNLNILKAVYVLEKSVEPYEVLPSSHCPAAWPHGFIVALMHYSSLTSLDQYLTQLLSLAHSDTKLYQTSVTLMLAHMFRGLLYLDNKQCNINKITSKDLLVVTSGDFKENYVLVNAYSLGLHQSSTSTFQFLKDLMSKLLQPVTPENPTESQTLSVYCKGWQKLESLLENGSSELLMMCKDVCEYLLWGPSEEQVKTMSLAEDRRQAFAAWLSVSRCQLIARYAVEPIAPSMQQAGLMNFLLHTNANSLFEVTKFLHQ